jgi:hypothetical protein
MSVYAVQRRREDDPKRRQQDVAMSLPSPKEPVAATAVVPVGNTYAVMPVGGDASPNPRAFPRPPISSPMGDTPVAPAGSSAPAPQPAGYDDPALAELSRALNQLKATRDAPVEKENRFKAALKMGAYAMGQAPAGGTWADVARQLGAFGGGAVSGAIRPKLPGAIKKMYDVQQREEDVVRAEKYANTASNITRRSNLTDLGYKNLTERQTAAKTKSLTSTQRILLAQLDRLGYIDPGDATHARLLNQAKEAGLNIDPTAYNAARGKGQPRVEIEDPDGHLKYTLQRDPKGNWAYVETPEGEKAVTGVGEKRDLDTGETLSSKRNYEFSREKFDFSKQIQTFNAQINAARLQVEQASLNLGKSKYDAGIEGKRAEAYALQSVADGIEGSIKAEEGKPFSARLDPADIEKLRKEAREKRSAATALFAEVDKAPQGGVNVGVPTPPTGKTAKSGITAGSLRAMTDAEFRAYYANSVNADGSHPTQAEVEAAVKRRKK